MNLPISPSTPPLASSGYTSGHHDPGLAVLDDEALSIGSRLRGGASCGLRQNPKPAD
jgi:hypothetical protein